MKKFLCIFISIILIISSGAATLYVMEFSRIFYEYRVYKVNVGVNIFKERDVTFWNYYSKTPNDLDPVKLIENTKITADIKGLYELIEKYSDDRISDSCVVKATYKGSKLRSEMLGDARVFYSEIEFELDEKVLGDCSDKVGDEISFFDDKAKLRCYSTIELLLHHYGEYYQKGEQYLIFKGEGSNLYSNKVMYTCKLSGEYPSIKMFPGPVEYDATYFGAGTKYVTADEFIELFIKAATEASQNGA